MNRVINLGNSKNVTLNGIDIDRVGRAIVGTDEDGVTDKEWLIAVRVARKVEKMKRKGHTAEQCARFARDAVVMEAQNLSGPVPARSTQAGRRSNTEP